MKYKRSLLKLSGETLMASNDSHGIALAAVTTVAQEIKSVVESGAQMAIVVGGGNFFRGATASQTNNIDQAQADRIGMLATVMNGIALKEGFLNIGQPVTLMSALPISNVVEAFNRHKALDCLQNGHVLICCGGTGNPYFSTDTAAALRALELNADAIVKGTKVDGIYCSDPKKNPDAKRFDKIEYSDVLAKKLRVMDLTAISMCMDHKLPIIVFDMFKQGNLLNAIMGETIGTVVYAK